MRAAASPSQSNPLDLPAPPKWEPLAVHINCIFLPRPLPLGEVDATTGSRRRGLARWPQSSPLQSCFPHGTGKRWKNRGFFVFRQFKVAARRNVRATACFYADMNAPAGSQRQHMPFAVTTFPVKMRLERPTGRDKRKYKIIFPLFMPRATRRAF